MIDDNDDSDNGGSFGYGFKFTWAKTSHNCSSVYSLKGSRLDLMVPANMVGSWGMMPKDDLSCCSGTVAIYDIF